jgi:hypothetical protein
LDTAVAAAVMSISVFLPVCYLGGGHSHCHHGFGWGKGFALHRDLWAIYKALGRPFFRLFLFFFLFRGCWCVHSNGIEARIPWSGLVLSKQKRRIFCERGEGL